MTASPTRTCSPPWASSHALPDDLARTLEDTFVALQSGNSAGAITLQACLRYIRQGDAADGQPWPAATAHPGSAWPWRASTAPAAGAEFPAGTAARQRMACAWTGISTSTWMTAREGLLLACRGLAEYVQLRAV